MLVKAASYILSKINMGLYFFCKGCDFTFIAAPCNWKSSFCVSPKGFK